MEVAESRWLVDTWAQELAPTWRALHRVTPAPTEGSWRERIDALLMFVCELGHPQNLYTATGIPRSHNAWELQLLVDGGLLFFLVVRCGEVVRAATSPDELRLGLEGLCCELDLSDAEALRERMRAFYAAEITNFLTRGRALVVPGGERATTYFECVLIHAYIRLAMTAPSAVFTLDLLPASTGPDNVREGLKGLVGVGLVRGERPTARRFLCIRAENYTRFYGLNLARRLESSSESLRFSLVVPYANGVRHLAFTRCWPIDAAENAARYIDQIRAAHQAYRVHRATLGKPLDTPAAKVLVSGYSQGGAAVRLLDDALSGVDVTARTHFEGAAPRGYRPRCRVLDRIIAGNWNRRPDGGPEVEIYTVSLATMGGVDGVGFHDRVPHLPELARDQRGASGVRCHANTQGGLHLGICHDLDPARWVMPAPLMNLGRWLRQRRKLNMVEVLLEFGGLNRAFHGGVWVSGTEPVFADNPPARALLDEVRAELVSDVFVDEAGYVDERCGRAAFPHLVVGTHGYPGWAVVEKFDEGLEALARATADRGCPRERAAALVEVEERSWALDILPDDHAYDDIVAAAMRFHEAHRRRARAVLESLERRGAGASERVLELLRGQIEPITRQHMLRVPG